MAFLILNLSYAAAQKHVTIQGVVIDNVTSLPLGNVKINIRDTKTVYSTDKSGKFGFDIPAINDPELEFSLEGYRTFSKKINVGKDTSEFLLISLSKLEFETPVIAVTDSKEKSGLDNLLELSNVLKDKELQNNLGQTVAATLKNETGIAIQSMGPAPSRPVYRGLSGDRVVLSEDGVKTTDMSATSPDHAVTIDPFSLQRIEVIRGPKVLLQTSTTIGGIINAVRNEIPQYLTDRVNLNFGSYYESSNNGYLLSGVLQVPLKNFEFRGEGTYRKSSDISSPEGVLPNTSIKTYTYSGGLSYIFDQSFAGVSGRNYTSDYGIPGGFIGAHPKGVNISMKREQLNFKLNHNINGKLIDYFDADFSFADYRHTEFERKDIIGAQFLIKNYLGSLNLYHNNFWSFKKGIYGISADFRNFKVGGYVFTPPSVSQSISMYFDEEIENIGKLSLEFAGRYHYNFIDPDQQIQLANLDSVYSRVFNTFSFSASAVYALNEAFNVGINLSRSSRVPTIEELYSDGPHLAAYSYEIGNPDLSDESGIGSEIFFYHNGEKVYSMLTLFYNKLYDYIIPRNTGEINYATLLPIYQTEGVNANMLGVEGQLEYNFLKNLNLNASLSYTYGQITGSDSPLPQIPPLKAIFELGYSKSNYFFGINSEIASAQNRVDEFEEPTAGYVIFGATGQYSIYGNNSAHNFSLNIENLTNQIYRNHLSRIKSIFPEPGFSIRLVYKFLY